jgi:single-stranded-DNA-specific exonuclease
MEYGAELSLAEITPELMAWIARLAPFGIGNPEPVFLTRDVTLAAPVRLIQDKHIALQLMQSGARGQSNPAAIPALGWSRDPLGWPARCTRLALAKGSAVDVLYRLRHNTGPYASPQFGGLELELCDLRPASTTLHS